MSAVNVTERSEMRDRITAFEREQAKKPQVQLKVVHHFAHGVVAREMHVPKGMEITGATHRYPNLNTLLQGEMLLITESGEMHVKAPFTFVAPAGAKRAALTLSDCIWTSYVGTHETDIEKIEAEFTDLHDAKQIAFDGVTKLEGK